MTGEYFINIKEQKVGVLFTSHLSVIMAENTLNDRMTLDMSNLVATAKEKQEKGESVAVENQKIGMLSMAMHCNNVYMGFLAWCEMQKDINGELDLPNLTKWDFQEWVMLEENKPTFFKLIEQYTKLMNGKPVEKATKKPVKKKAKKSLRKRIFGR